MTEDVISATEDALLAALTQALEGTKVRTDSLPGDWDDDMLKRMLSLAPCVLVAFGGGGAKNVGVAEPVIDGQWLVYVVTSHPSGQAARRRGNRQAVGAYELLSRTVVPTLHGLTVPNIGTLVLNRLENLFTGTVERQGLAVYACAFSLPMPFDLGGEASSLADFLTFVAQYDIPAHDSEAEHQKWLDGNFSSSKPDASDSVSLPPQP